MKKVVEARGSLIVIKQRVSESLNKNDRGEYTTKSGIVLTKEAVEGGTLEEFEGEILAVGPIVTKFKKGEIVSFGQHAGTIKSWNKQEYWLLYEHSINTVEKLVKDDAKLSSAEFVVAENIEHIHKLKGPKPIPNLKAPKPIPKLKGPKPIPKLKGPKPTLKEMETKLKNLN